MKYVCITCEVKLIDNPIYDTVEVERCHIFYRVCVCYSLSCALLNAVLESLFKFNSTF